MKIKFEEKSTPHNYYKYPSDRQLGKTMKMWKVQTEAYEDGKGYWIGQIMDDTGFSQKKDCELISGGLSTKNVNAMAIARSRNILHWGFSASPSFMTESAKKVFVNTVFYMANLNKAGKK